MMTPAEQVEEFVARFDSAHNTVGRPLWIHVRIEDQHRAYEAECRFDFKLDEARKAFGALCHRLYTSAEKWKIETHN